MTYPEFEKEILEMTASATEAARLRFARETIGLLRDSAAAAMATELAEAERGMLADILAGVESGSMNGLSLRLEELLDRLCRDDVRAIEFHPDITELLCAIDNLLVYSATKDPKFIAQVAINWVNSIDHAVGADSESYVAGDMMGAGQMREEYERQRRLLVGPGP